MSDKRIVKARVHKVADGDDLSTLLGDKVTIKEFLRFNFGSDNQNKLNDYLRDYVGCRKKTEDGKNYIFTSKDDPGIIYIPEELPEKSFSSNGSHTITVKKVARKKFITSKCMAEFRPHSAWKGEFGFDWLRISRLDSENYESLLKGGYKGNDASGKPESFSEADAFTKLKGEYESLKTVVKGKPEYFIPYINVYPEKTPGDPKPPDTVKLKIILTIEDETAEELKMEFNKEYFEMVPNTPVSFPKGVGKHELEISIKCIKEFSSDQQIKIVAETRETSGKFLSYVAGKIIIGINNASHRKEVKFVLVKVKTKIRRSENTGNIPAAEKKRLADALHQALIHGIFENGPDLDLTNDEEYKITTTLFFRKKYGKFIYKTNGTDGNIDGGVWEDYPDQGMFKDMRKKYIDIHSKYRDYFTIFALDEPTFDPVTYGQVQKFGIHNVALFKNPGGNRPEGVLAHEVGHGLGLEHSHAVVEGPNNKFVFEKSKTDNIMSYNFTSMMTTWRWQWLIMKSSL